MGTSQELEGRAELCGCGSLRLRATVSASSTACLTPIDDPIRRSRSTATNRTLARFGSSKATTHSGRMRERIPALKR